MSDIIAKAWVLADEAHKTQSRKWNQEPYIVHPEWCAKKSKETGGDIIEQCVMLLHDVIEDQAIPTNTVEWWEHRIVNELDPVGEIVLKLVWELTNVSDTKEWQEKNPNPRRSEKWAANLAHILEISDKAKRCKMIDRLANILTMANAPLRMKQKYIPESRELLAACRHADEKLGEELETAIDNLERNIS